MNVTSPGANKDAVGAKTKDNSVRDTLAHLMLRNLSEVFGERDSERRMAAIKNLSSEAPLFSKRNSGSRGARQSATPCSAQRLLPAEFEFSAVVPPARNHDVGRLFWQLGPAGSPPVVNGMDVAQFKDGRIHSLYVFLNDEDHSGSRAQSSSCAKRNCLPWCLPACGRPHRHPFPFFPPPPPPPFFFFLRTRRPS